MFFPWTAFTLLAFESANVINMRLEKIGSGGTSAMNEIWLMCAEKTFAACEAAFGTMTPAGLVARYRFHVEENRERLSRA